MKYTLLIGVLLAALGLGGCVARTAAVSTGKQAYVVKGSMFGTAMYHCDAAHGYPTCTKVTEQKLGGAK